VNIYKAQRGQAMMEYQVLIPIGIMIMVVAGLVGGFIVDSLDQTVDAFEPYGVACAPDEPADVGPEVATPGNHMVELTSSVYNETDDTTTIVYTVTSGDSPSISHWTLGLPEFVAANILESSEKIEDWGVDPTTGVAGSKFDTGYEVEGGEGGGPPGGPPPGKGGKKSKLLSPVFVVKADTATVSREVTLLVSGHYDFGPVETSVKAGTDVYVFSISAPIRYHDPSLDVGCGDAV